MHREFARKVHGMVFNFARTGSAALLFALAAPSVWAAGHAAYFKMKQVQVIDVHGFAQPMPAEDLLIPSDWSMEGEVTWANHGCPADTAWIRWRAKSPDGKIVIEGYPWFTWQFANSPQEQKQMQYWNQQHARAAAMAHDTRPPCPVFQPVSAADILSTKIVPAIRPGKPIVAMEAIPDLDKFVKERAHQLQASAAQAGHNLQVQSDAARARLKYDQDGVAVEEWVIAASTSRATPEGGGAIQYDNQAFMVLTLRAPAGQLDAQEALLRVVRGSIHPAAQWVNQYSQFLVKKQQIQNDLVGYATDLQRRVNANAQRASSIGFQQADQGIRDVETYRDPRTGRKIELSNQYGHAWSNGNDQYIVSEDPNFNPDASVGGNWTSLEHAQPDP